MTNLLLRILHLEQTLKTALDTKNDFRNNSKVIIYPIKDDCRIWRSWKMEMLWKLDLS